MAENPPKVRVRLPVKLERFLRGITRHFGLRLIGVLAVLAAPTARILPSGVAPMITRIHCA